MKQGKTTILTAVKLLFGGPFPADIIRHGETSAHVALTWDGGSLRREFYVGRDGQAKARPISYVLDGVPQKDPVRRIREMLNPFLLDQDHLIRMNDREVKEYLLDVLGVDTSDLDGQIQAEQEKAKELRAQIKAFGEIDTTPVEPPDIEALHAERKAIEEQHRATLARYEELRRLATERADVRADLEEQVATHTQAQADIRERINRLQLDLRDEQAATEAAIARLMELPELSAPEEPAPPDTSELDERISDAKAQAVRYEEYRRRVGRAEEKARLEMELKQRTMAAGEYKRRRLSMLRAAAESCPVEGLTMTEDGEPLFEGTPLDMISHSQKMRLSSALSTLYPEGLGIELIDRGESLGRSIWGLIDHAKEHDRTVLTTVVGDEPAVVPEDVGVFVVEEGRVQAKDEA